MSYLLLVCSRTVGKASSHLAELDGRDFKVAVSKLAGRRWRRGYWLRIDGTRAVSGADLVVRVVGFDEANVLVDAAGPDACFVVGLGVAETGGRAPVDRSDVEVVTVADDL